MTGEGLFFSGRNSRFSQTIANTKTFTIDTALNLQTLPKKGGMPMIPTTTGGLFTKNVPVFYDVDENGSVIPFGMRKHYHDDDLDTNGGIASEVYFRNAGLMVPFYLYQFHPTNWIEEKTGTGAGRCGRDDCGSTWASPSRTCPCCLPRPKTPTRSRRRRAIAVAIAIAIAIGLDDGRARGAVAR